MCISSGSHDNEFSWILGYKSHIISGEELRFYWGIMFITLFDINRGVIQTKNSPLLFNGLFFVELLLPDSLNQVAYGLRSLRTALLQLGIKVFF